MRKKLLYLLLFSVSISYAQPEDLKVGLVLSGGGAKGIAHVGALKVIEESGVRIDYIGGSSMGAVVGALYAAGYSASQIETLFLQSDLNLLIRDQYPRRSMSFTEKEDRERYAITIGSDMPLHCHLIVFKLNFQVPFRGVRMYIICSSSCCTMYTMLKILTICPSLSFALLPTLRQVNSLFWITDFCL
jgi:hypothetical protein